MYIIEDNEVSYWKSGKIYGYSANYGIRHYLSIVETFKLLIDYVNSKFLSEEEQKKLDENTRFISQETRDSILSINFSPNCIIIKKKVNIIWIT